MIQKRQSYGHLKQKSLEPDSHSPSIAEKGEITEQNVVVHTITLKDRSTHNNP
jgi:hypothetical protein